MVDFIYFIIILLVLQKNKCFVKAVFTGQFIRRLVILRPMQVFQSSLVYLYSFNESHLLIKPLIVEKCIWMFQRMRNAVSLSSYNVFNQKHSTVIKEYPVILYPLSVNSSKNKISKTRKWMFSNFCAIFTFFDRCKKEKSLISEKSVLGKSCCSYGI